ncbi:hypothetical protein [Pseudomonas putida]|uniref:hypothetical protein n=1 Tax=Pseudomonas putida TaxID=303 RepID=UPI001E482EC8|nr:hypothetical protein [Pseudomonas putida]MCC9005558.1 hypothetical protein [Pseudomonas putida]
MLLVLGIDDRYVSPVVAYIAFSESVIISGYLLLLDMILRPILELTEIWFIHGNHDSDGAAFWRNLHGCGLAERSLHARMSILRAIA